MPIVTATARRLEWRPSRRRQHRPARQPHAEPPAVLDPVRSIGRRVCGIIFASQEQRDHRAGLAQSLRQRDGAVKRAVSLGELLDSKGSSDFSPLRIARLISRTLPIWQAVHRVAVTDLSDSLDFVPLK